MSELSDGAKEIRQLLDTVPDLFSEEEWERIKDGRERIIQARGRLAEWEAVLSAELARLITACFFGSGTKADAFYDHLVPRNFGNRVQIFDKVLAELYPALSKPWLKSALIKFGEFRNKVVHGVIDTIEAALQSQMPDRVLVRRPAKVDEEVTYDAINEQLDTCKDVYAELLQLGFDLEHERDK